MQDDDALQAIFCHAAGENVQLPQTLLSRMDYG